MMDDLQELCIFARRVAYRRWRHDEAESVAYVALNEAIMTYEQMQTNNLRGHIAYIVDLRVLDAFRLWTHSRDVAYVDLTTLDVLRSDSPYLRTEELDYERVEEGLEAAYICSRVRAGLTQLPVPQRRVLAGRARGETLDEIGARLGIHKSRVSQILKRARTQITGLKHCG